MTTWIPLIAGPAAPQIGVEVNGRPVSFGAVGPVRQEGRVLVPLRAVGEALDATIRWNGALRTVFGEKGSRQFELPLGRQEAVVDGRPVRLDVPAQTVHGTTMVPLRFVAEALGADVRWNAATQSVVVSTDGVPAAPTIAGAVTGEIVSVNPVARPARIVVSSQGVRTSYDVPAGAVVLRSAAGGRAVQVDVDQLQPGDRVELHLDAAGQTATLVRATAADGALPTAPAADGVRISSFRHSADAVLAAGQILTVTLIGTPGGRASFDVGSLARDVPMSEDPGTPGRYTGRFTVPKGITDRDIPIIGHLSVRGTAAPIVQAGTPLTVDAEPPTLTAIAPADGAVVAGSRPDIYAEFSDAGGTGLDVRTVRFQVNGRDVTSESRVTPGFVIYTPENLPAGPVRVNLSARDRAGNLLEHAWTFRVDPQSGTLQEVTHNAQKPLGAGDVLTVRARGRPGGQATFSIAGVAQQLRMTEQSPGSYVGTYTVKRGDQQLKAGVSVQLVLANGDRQSLQAAAPVSILTREVQAPTVTSPAAGTEIKSPVVVTGRGEPGSRVLVEVVYTARAFGLLPIQGTAASQEVTVAESGTFRTEPLELKLPAGASRARYEVRASNAETDDPT